MEALARRAEALFGESLRTKARSEAEGALRYFRTRPESARVARDDFAALATFVLAETWPRRPRSSSLPAKSTFSAPCSSAEPRSCSKRSVCTSNDPLPHPDALRCRGSPDGVLYDKSAVR